MQIHDVDISLSLGQLIWKKQKGIKSIWCLLLVPTLLPLITIMLIVALRVNQIQFDRVIIFIIVILNVMFLLIEILPIYLIIKDRKNKNKIKLWLEDAIETKAYSKKLVIKKCHSCHRGIQYK